MKPTPSMAVAVTALVVSLGGTAAGASHLLSGSKIKKASIPGNRLKKDSVTGAQVDEARLGTVPNAAHAVAADSAAHADSATSAGGAPPTGAAGGALIGSYPSPSLAPPEAWHEVGAPGEPAFLHACANAGGDNGAVGFYKDQLGIVHLKGAYTCSPAGATGNSVFTLPVGYRPAAGTALRVPVACDCEFGSTPSETGIVGVRDDGAVILTSAEHVAGVGTTHLDGVSFRAES